MSLPPGTRLGPYEVLSTLGEEPEERYKASDTQMNRVVTLKMLPPGFSGHPEMRARLEHDTQTISSLNHPNISALVGVGHQDPAIDFVVAEYVEGETLAERLARGPMDLPEALTRGDRDRRLARQGAPAGHRAWGIESDGRDADAARPQGVRLRPREAAGRARLRRRRDDGDDADVRDVAVRGSGVCRAVHGPRAVRRERGRRAKRHLRVRRGSLRDGHRQAGVSGEDAGAPHRRGSDGRSGTGFKSAGDGAARARLPREAVPAEGPPTATADRAGPDERASVGVGRKHESRAPGGGSGEQEENRSRRLGGARDRVCPGHRPRTLCTFELREGARTGSGPLSGPEHSDRDRDAAGALSGRPLAGREPGRRRKWRPRCAAPRCRDSATPRPREQRHAALLGAGQPLGRVLRERRAEAGRHRWRPGTDHLRRSATSFSGHLEQRGRHPVPRQSRDSASARRRWSTDGRHEAGRSKGRKRTRLAGVSAGRQTLSVSRGVVAARRERDLRRHARLRPAHETVRLGIEGGLRRARLSPVQSGRHGVRAGASTRTS